MSVINVFAADPRKNEHGESSAIVVGGCTNTQRGSSSLSALSRMHLGIR